jgi:hypothetical protein
MGVVWVRLAGHMWTGHVWTGQVWTGHVWTGQVWTGHAWTGYVWTGHVWTGHVWTGHVWTGQVWTGHMCAEIKETYRGSALRRWCFAQVQKAPTLAPTDQETLPNYTVEIFTWPCFYRGKSGGGVLRYPVPKWLLFPKSMWGVVFTACVVFSFKKEHSLSHSPIRKRSPFLPS